MKIPLYCLPPLFTTHTDIPADTPIPPPLFVALFLWLNGWSRHIWCFILLNEIMDLHMLSLGILAPQRPCSVLYATRFQITTVKHMTWFFASTLIWYHTHTRTHARTHTHTAQTGAKRQKHPYKFIVLPPPVMC